MPGRTIVLAPPLIKLYVRKLLSDVSFMGGIPGNNGNERKQLED
jgi:hypothetical protein